MSARIKQNYQKEVVPRLMKERELRERDGGAPAQKVVVNMGVGEATQNIKLLDAAMEELGRITGQRPAMRRARKSIAAFKLRQGMPIAATVTLRGDRMYEFVDRLVNVALPRVRDFRGVPTNSFDGRGNYTLGLRDQLIFPEVDYAKVDKLRGMNVTFVTTARTDEESKLLLRYLGMPFRQPVGGESGEAVADCQGQADAEVRGPRATTAAGSCGRPRGYLRKFEMCRICFRKLALAGDDPRRDQGELVGRGKRHEHDRSHRRHDHAHPQRRAGAAAQGGRPRLQAQGRDRAHPEGRGLHRQLQGSSRTTSRACCAST